MNDLQQALDKLNPQQKQAVDIQNGPLLIVAGAGSGKTGVITARIASMLKAGIRQSNILALTFTNKAADEMQARVKALTGLKITNLTISTFHAFGLRIIRENVTTCDRRPNFTIHDNSDKLSAIRESARELGLDYEPSEINAIGNLFSDIKTRRERWNSSNKFHKELYSEYQQMMGLYNAVDFDDLIIKPLELFESNVHIRGKYRQQFQYIMVDEFQDTSQIQYQVVRQIAEDHRNICCVGDDDQSIYSWRGANYTNIANFESDFPELTEIRLERNYRSTGMILKAANAVIANNNNRKDKVLWTDEKPNETKIRFAMPEDETEESMFITDTIISLKQEGNLSLDDFGILVRTNTLTRSIENALLSANIPYTVSGGLSFFGRPEIKDIIAYLRVIDNPDDDVNFLRIVNTPRRGVGKKSLEFLNQTARARGISLYAAACAAVFDSSKSVSESIRRGLAEFVDIIEEYRIVFNTQKKSQSLAQSTKALIEEINYWEFLLDEFKTNDKIAKWRYENIQSFIDMLETWEAHPDNLNPKLNRWLNKITLNTRDQIDTDSDDKVNLMTIHASKGLEFDVVFLPGVEKGIIPHAKSLEQGAEFLAEERRIFYVAITRARKELYISCCQTRKVRSETITCMPSDFLNEIPDELMEDAQIDDSIPDGDALEKYFSRMPWK